MDNETPKRPVGRPRTSLANLPENWKQIGTELAQQGAAAVEIMCALGISRVAYQTLCEDFEDFSTADNEWKLLCEQWWHMQGRLMTTGANDKGQATVWKFNMQNRFKWRDKVDTEIANRDGEAFRTIDASKLSEAALRELLASRVDSTENQ